MTDYSELKRLAEAVQSQSNWHAAGIALQVFNAQATPAAVLALIAENERLDLESQSLSDHLGRCDRERRAFRDERDQLKAEVEALRKDAARYRWLRAQPNDCSAPRIDICSWTRNGDDSVNEGDWLRMEKADAVIDAAMTKEQG